MNLPAFMREQVPLAPLTTYGIGGPARWFAQPATVDEVREALLFAREWNVRPYFLGGGSNLLVGDGGVDGMVVRLSSAGEFGQKEATAPDGLCWHVGAAVPLPSFVNHMVRGGVRGLETLAGIPGTVGGAVTMNAGADAGGIGSFVESGQVIGFDGTIHAWDSADFRFGYRESAVSDVLALDFSFRFPELASPAELRNHARQYRERKRASQPLTIPSAGCVFKNPAGDSAGSLLDAAGCKGLREGDAVVSSVHANFIVNQKHATAMDVLRLVGRMRELVWRRTGISLEPEIRVWGMDEEFAEIMRYTGT